MKIYLKLILLLLISCNQEAEPQKDQALSLQGTWQLIAATTIEGDSVHHKDLSQRKMIKIINENHFSFLDHDINKEKDSLNYFVAGGGSYTLNNDQYTESLDFCNFREWEGFKFDFTLDIKGDTLIQTGLEEVEELGVNREIIEIYKRI